MLIPIHRRQAHEQLKQQVYSSQVNIEDLLKRHAQVGTFVILWSSALKNFVKEAKEFAEKLRQSEVESAALTQELSQASKVVPPDLCVRT